VARIACLRVADLPLAAELRAHPEWAERPLVIASAGGPRAEVVSVSQAAARRGVRRGSSIAHARTLCASLVVRIASPALERAARAALLDVALSFSPRATLLPPARGAFAPEAVALLDASGIGALFRSERGFAAALAERARHLGLPANVAVAGSRSVARLAARQLARSGGETRVVAPGGEAELLAPLPIDLLDPDDELAARLTRFGIRTLRDLLGLPTHALAARLGPRALELVALARGTAEDPPLPVPTRTRLQEAVDLDHPVERLEPLLFVLQGLLSRLLARLELRHLACGDLALGLDLAGGGRDARRIGVAAATHDLRVLLRLLHTGLEARPPEAPVEGVRIETRGLPLRNDQLDLFRPVGPSPRALERVLAELTSLCGEDRVGAPRVADHHHPDASALERFDPSRAEARCASPPGSAAPDLTSALALRVLRPPVSAQVRMAGDRPESVRSAVASGRVVRQAGPWRTTGGWWSQEGRFAFDHFDVLTSDGTVSRLRFDHVARSWQIDGVYD
jgi:protein ImuB